MVELNAFVHDSDNDVAAAGGEVPGLRRRDLRHAVKRAEAWIVGSVVSLQKVIRFSVQNIVSGSKRGNGFPGVGRVRHAQTIDQIGAFKAIDSNRDLLLRRGDTLRCATSVRYRQDY